MNQYQPPSPRPYGYPPLQNYYEQLLYKKPLRRWATIIGIGLLLHLAIRLILSSVWVEVAAGLLFYVLDPGLVSLIGESVDLFIYVASLWPVTLFVTAWIKIPPELAFPLRKPRLAITLPGLFVCLGASMVGFLVTTAISWVMEAVFGLYSIPPNIVLPQGIAANVVSIVSMTLVPAVFEELLFRGAILQSLRRFGDGFAMIVSAVLFGLLHGNLSQMPTTFLLGLLFAYFVLRTGSILPAMFFHFVNNGLATAFEYISDYLTDAQFAVMNMSMFAGYILLGIVGLLFLALRVGGLFQMAPSDYPLPTGKKVATFFLSPALLIFLAVIIFITVSYLAPY
jgi:membrane protease YdiL (CAAX protease family)